MDAKPRVEAWGQVGRLVFADDVLRRIVHNALRLDAFKTSYSML